MRLRDRGPTRRAAQLYQRRPYAECWPCVTEPLVEGDQRPAIVRANCKMQGIAGTQAQIMMLREPGSSKKMDGRDSQSAQALGTKVGELRKRLGAPVRIELPGTLLDRERG